MFIGCAGWRECDVTYPLPQGKVEGAARDVPHLRHAAGEGDGVSQQAAHPLHRPVLPDQPRADVWWWRVPACKAAGKAAKLVAQKNPATLKRFIRCENYEECNTGYPLPQNGRLEATDEVCEHCGAPLVVVTTARPMKLCPNFDCPGKEEEKEKKGRGRAWALPQREGLGQARREGKARREEGLGGASGALPRCRASSGAKSAIPASGSLPARFRRRIPKPAISLFAPLRLEGRQAACGDSETAEKVRKACISGGHARRRPVRGTIAWKSAPEQTDEQADRQQANSK